MIAPNPTLTPTLPALHLCIARHLTDQTGVWFGPHCVGVAITLALRSTGQIRTSVNWTERRGLCIEGLAVTDLADALNNRAGIEEPDEQVTPADVTAALAAAMRVAFGHHGGSWTMWRDGWDVDNLLSEVADCITWGSN